MFQRLGLQPATWTFNTCPDTKISLPKTFVVTDILITMLMKSNKMQEYADIYLLLNHSTCFVCPSHPSSGIHKIVIAASGTDHTIWEASFFQRDQIRTDLGQSVYRLSQTSPYLVPR